MKPTRLPIGILLIVSLLFLAIPISVWRMRESRSQADIRSRAAGEQFAAGPSPTSAPQSTAATVYQAMVARLGSSGRTIRIDDPANGFSGSILVAADPALGRTFFVSRIAGLLPLEGTVARWWLVDDAGVQTPLGEFVIEEESGIPVAYGSKSIEGDIASFRSLVISFDPPEQASAPASILWQSGL